LNSIRAHSTTEPDSKVLIPVGIPKIATCFLGTRAFIHTITESARYFYILSAFYYAIYYATYYAKPPNVVFPPLNKTPTGLFRKLAMTSRSMGFRRAV
jgi:hypothetical protein